MGIVRKQGGDRREVTSGGNSHELRADTHEMRQVLRPNRLLALRPSPRREALAAPWRTPGSLNDALTGARRNSTSKSGLERRPKGRLRR